MNKIITISNAVSMVKDGMTIMIGGFLGCGNPHKIIEALCETDVKDLNLICNDGGLPDYGVAKLIAKKKIKSLMASHVGMNPDVANQQHSGELALTLVPQGSLAEMIRAGGAGLGGVLTPTGIGTIVADGKQVIQIDGKDFLLEKPLRADVALICGYKVDKKGNVWYKGVTRNFNVCMATAADIVIVEADNIVECGEITPEDVVTPGIYVDYIVNGGEIK